MRDLGAMKHAGTVFNSITPANNHLFNYFVHVPTRLQIKVGSSSMKELSAYMLFNGSGDLFKFSTSVVMAKVGHE